MDQNIDPKKRLHLNFGLGERGYNTNTNNNNDRAYTPNNERVFPTTPSTFPQPIFQTGQVPNVPTDYVGAGPVHSPYVGGAGGGYFPTTTNYQTQYNQAQSPYQQPQYQQAQYQPQYQQQNLAAPQPSYQQQRQAGYSTNDPTSGLARQFSNQNLGTPQRQPSPFARQPASPNPRLYPNGQQSQVHQNRGQQNQQAHTSNQQNQSGMLSPAPPAAGSTSLVVPEDPGEKTPEKYSANVPKRVHGLHATVETFFKENISRARERNTRYALLFISVLLCLKRI